MTYTLTLVNRGQPSVLTSDFTPPNFFTQHLSPETTRSVLFKNDTFFWLLCCRTAQDKDAIYTLHAVGPAPQFPLYVVDTAHLSNDRATYKRTMNSGYHCSGCLRFSKMSLFIFNDTERESACTKDVLVLWGGPRTAFSSQVSSFTVSSGDQSRLSSLYGKPFTH